MTEGELKAIKVENPNYLGVIAPFINSFLEKVDIQGVTYESFYTYLAKSVQQGQAALISGVRDTEELWIVTEDNKPVAIAHWYVMGLPMIGCVYCDIVYSWQTKKAPVALLGDQFIRFGRDHRCPTYIFDVANERVFQVISKHLNAKGLEVNKTERINSWAVKAAVAAK